MALVVPVFAACGLPSDADDSAAPDGGGDDVTVCPAALNEGDACSFPGQCWRANDFSSCMSGWCSCRAGRFECDAIAPDEGDACGDEPITSCSYEGNPSCDTLPTAVGCTCDAGGTWRCDCFCYGPGTTCATDPCSLPPERISGRLCAAEGSVCSYPGNVSCRCEVGNDGLAKFVCT